MGGVKADDMRAAMRSLEDEHDAAAALAAEKETAAELAEFNAEASPGLAGEGEGAADRDGARSEERGGSPGGESGR